MQLQLPDFSKAKLIVIGDIMLDRYLIGNTSRISPEAPVPVVHIKEQDERPGGAGNVALNIAALGAQVELIGVVGNDAMADRLQAKLTAAKVNSHLLRLDNIPTISKLRVLSRQQQLIRLDFEETIVLENTDFLIQKFNAAIESADAVILSDYGKGTLDLCRQQLIQIANKAKVPVLVDPKGHDFKEYQGATLLTPNFKEFELVVGPCTSERMIIEKAAAAIDDNELSALLVTRGAEGMTLLRKDMTELHLPAQAREVYDVTGAGDTVISVLAACIACGTQLEHATVLANIAAGIAVAKLGAVAISVPEIRRELLKKQHMDTGIISEQQLKQVLMDAKAAGEKIVFTNGCFDILHAGHITYLEEARAQGDRLVVAVNSDDSVKRLKGEARPINNLTHRMAVLAGLAAVDWVVPFSEDTPARLIAELSPDVLVKGGDYKVEEIAGSDTVLQQGGTVKILSFVEGLSTTKIVERMSEKEKAC